jgi:inorganic pyrophosphatase
MAYRTNESPRRRGEGIGLVVRSQATDRRRDLGFAHHPLTQSMAGSTGISSRQCQRSVAGVTTSSPATPLTAWASIADNARGPVTSTRPPRSGRYPLRGAAALEELRPKGTPVAEDEIEVVIEIPRGSRNKHEFGHERQIIRRDRRPSSTTSYPADYGFVPDALAQDGDPMDALVLVEDPTFPGGHVMARPVAVLWMADEKGPDAKIIFVPTHEPRWHAVAYFDQLPGGLSDEIRHFFDVHEDPEPYKETSVKGYEGRRAALAEIEASCERFRSSHIEVKK